MSTSTASSPGVATGWRPRRGRRPRTSASSRTQDGVATRLPRLPQSPARGPTDAHDDARPAPLALEGDDPRCDRGAPAAASQPDRSGGHNGTTWPSLTVGLRYDRRGTAGRRPVRGVRHAAYADRRVRGPRRDASISWGG